MSDDPKYGATITIYASADGGAVGATWVLGAAAAALAFGSGYIAWQNNTPNPHDAQITSYDLSAAEPLRAGPLPPSREMLAANAARESLAAPHHAVTRTTTHLRRSPARAVAAAEETFGATDSDEIVVTGTHRPVWLRTPSPRRLAALYPQRARERGREGEARLRCIVQASGRLTCERMSETPGGFGRAALRVARAFRHAPQFADGSTAAGAPVNLRIVFRMADDERRHG